MEKEIAELAQDSIFILDKNFTVRYLNDCAAGHFGSPKDTLIGKNINELFPLHIYETQKKALQKVLEEDKPLTFVNRIEFPDKALWLDTKLVPLKDENGEVSAVLGISRDITGYKETQDLIVHAKHEWERAVDAIDDLVAVVDHEYHILRVNKAMARHLGVPVQKAVGLICYNYLHKLGEPPQYCPLHHQKKKGMKEGGLNFRMENVDGDNFVSVSPLHDHEGRLTGYVCVTRPAQQTETEKSCLKNKNGLKSLMKKAHYIIFMQDKEGKYAFFDAMPKCGLETEDFIGKTPFDFFEPAAAAAMLELIKQVAASGHEINQYKQIEDATFFEQISPVRNAVGEVTTVTTILRKFGLPPPDKKESAAQGFSVYNLTRRECEILRLIAAGYTSGQIADKLFISKTTVETHRARIMKKCNLHKTAQLVKLAINLGLYHQ
jgi:PAS domain S-box-containing protein